VEKLSLRKIFLGLAEFFVGLRKFFVDQTFENRGQRAAFLGFFWEKPVS
jgi:hypothetical protein